MTNKQMRRELRKLAALMQDTQKIELTITIPQLWHVIAGLQLAWRHPGLGKPMKDTLHQITRQLSVPILITHPEMDNLLEMGWNENFDKPADTEIDHD